MRRAWLWFRRVVLGRRPWVDPDGPNCWYVGTATGVLKYRREPDGRSVIVKECTDGKTWVYK